MRTPEVLFFFPCSGPQSTPATRAPSRRARKDVLLETLVANYARYSAAAETQNAISTEMLANSVQVRIFDGDTLVLARLKVEYIFQQFFFLARNYTLLHNHNVTKLAAQKLSRGWRHGSTSITPHFEAAAHTCRGFFCVTSALCVKTTAQELVLPCTMKVFMPCSRAGIYVSITWQCRIVQNCNYYKQHNAVLQETIFMSMV